MEATAIAVAAVIASALAFAAGYWIGANDRDALDQALHQSEVDRLQAELGALRAEMGWRR